MFSKLYYLTTCLNIHQSYKAFWSKLTYNSYKLGHFIIAHNFLNFNETIQLTKIKLWDRVQPQSVPDSQRRTFYENDFIYFLFFILLLQYSAKRHSYTLVDSANGAAFSLLESGRRRKCSTRNDRLDRTDRQQKFLPLKQCSLSRKSSYENVEYKFN